MASFSENAWHAVNRVLSIRREQMAWNPELLDIQWISAA